MKLVIVIEGKLDELFAVGPTDLRTSILPEALHIKPEQIKKCWFEELQTKDGKVITPHEALWHYPEHVLLSHPDNYNVPRPKCSGPNALPNPCDVCKVQPCDYEGDT